MVGKELDVGKQRGEKEMAVKGKKAQGDRCVDIEKEQRVRAHLVWHLTIWLVLFPCNFPRRKRRREL